MVLLIEGVEIPRGCDECFCCQPDAHFCRYTCGILNEDVMDDDTGELFTNRPPWCPLKEATHGE